MGLGRQAEALADLEEVLDAKPHYALALDWASRCAFEVGDGRKGLRLARRALRLGEPAAYRAWPGSGVAADRAAIGMEIRRAETRLAEARCGARQPGPKGRPDRAAVRQRRPGRDRLPIGHRRLVPGQAEAWGARAAGPSRKGGRRGEAPDAARIAAASDDFSGVTMVVAVVGGALRMGSGTVANALGLVLGTWVERTLVSDLRRGSRLR